jgi:hypothetical protein
MSFFVVVLALWAGGTIACHNPTTATPAPTSTSPSATVQKIEILGSTRVGPIGATTQLTARETLANGNQVDATSFLSWGSEDTSIATVAAGLVTAKGWGQTSIYFGQVPLARVMMTVVPPGKYLVLGSVSEPGPEPIPAATVEVISGVDLGTSTNTTANGTFVLPVSGSLQLSTSKPGYVTDTRPLSVNADQSLGIELQPETPPTSIAGTFQVTLQAAPGCQLPADAMTRHYTGNIGETGARVTGTLSGAQLVSNGYVTTTPSFTGRVTGTSVTISIAYDDYYGIFDVLEKISDSLFLGFYGDATGDVRNGVIDTRLSGTLSAYNGSPYDRSSVLLSTCRSDAHRLTFTNATTALSRRRR